MIAWFGYAMLVSLLLGVAALAAERAARMRRAPTRWVWAGAIVLSLLLPTVVSSISIELPNIFKPAQESTRLVLRDATAVRLAAPEWIARQAAPVVAAATRAVDIDPLLRRIWLAVSGAMLLALGASAVLLHARKRHWKTARVAGAEVYIAPDAGPAVVGLLRPRIVLPAWLIDAPASKQALVVAHETSHLVAKDPLLLSVALCLLVLMPWNLPLWWQLRCLRQAIEVDCDTRVLQAGHDLRSYGEALVDVGQRQSGYLAGVAGMAQSQSFLERRIGIMLQAPGRRTGPAALLLSSLALCMVATAAQVTPPNASAGAQAAQRPAVALSERQEVRVSPSRLLDYEGAYRLDEFRTMTLTREGRRLWSQVSGKEKIELYPERSDYFFSRDIDMQVSFERDGRGKVTGLAIHRFGLERPLPLLSQTEVAEVGARFAERAKRTKPWPGGQETVWRNALTFPTGELNDADLSPVVAAQARAIMPFFKKSQKDNPWGKPLAITFARVAEDGSDVYLIEHENVIVKWMIQFDSSGKIADAVFVELLN